MTLSNFPSKFPIVWEFERLFAVGFIAHCARALHYIPDKTRLFPKNPAFSLPKLYIFYALISNGRTQKFVYSPFQSKHIQRRLHKIVNIFGVAAAGIAFNDFKQIRIFEIVENQVFQ